MTIPGLIKSYLQQGAFMPRFRVGKVGVALVDPGQKPPFVALPIANFGDQPCVPAVEDGPGMACRAVYAASRGLIEIGRIGHVDVELEPGRRDCG